GPRDRDFDCLQHRRSADPGRQPLSFLRDQSGAEVRPQEGPRDAARRRGRDGRSVRARPDPRSQAGRTRRRAHRLWIPRGGDGKTLTFLLIADQYVVAVQAGAIAEINRRERWVKCRSGNGFSWSLSYSYIFIRQSRFCTKRDTAGGGAFFGSCRW